MGKRWHGLGLGARLVESDGSKVCRVPTGWRAAKNGNLIGPWGAGDLRREMQDLWHYRVGGQAFMLVPSNERGTT
jgi:hypothetical protein